MKHSCFSSFFLLFLCFTQPSFSQLPTGSIAPDFTLTDIEGNEYNLYSILDEGKSVLLDLFAVWCGPCWTFAETGVFDAFNETYGNSVVTLAVEADPTTPLGSLYGGGNSIGDWTELITYPLANDDLIADSSFYNLNYYPTIYLICPDRTVTEIGQVSPNNSYWTVSTLAQEVFQYTCEAIQGPNVGIQSYDSEVNYCGANKIEPIITISNTGSSLITSCTIETIVDGVVENSFDWTGYLPFLSVEQILLDEFSTNVEEVTFRVVMDEDVLEMDDSIVVNLFPAIESHSFVHIDVKTDYYPGETSWEIVSFDNQVWSSGQYQEGDIDQYGAGGPDAFQSFNHSVSLPQGCYSFRVFDSSGNGQFANSGGGSGYEASVIVGDAYGTELLNVSGNWGSYQSVDFEVTYGMGENELQDNKVTIFPNPASEHSSISFNLHEPKDVLVEVCNNIGQTVFSYSSKINAGEQSIDIPVSVLPAGSYFIKCTMNHTSITKKIMVVK